MSYGLNVEMRKQAEIGKGLHGMRAQVLAYLSQEHQLQALGAISGLSRALLPS